MAFPAAIAVRRLLLFNAPHLVLEGLREPKSGKRFAAATGVLSVRPWISLSTPLHRLATICASSTQPSPTFAGGRVPDMKTGEVEKPVVSAHWLHDNLESEDIKVLDASWYMPAEKRRPRQEYEASHIPNAIFFDLDKIVDLSSDLPHMLPSEDAFAAAVSALGIENKDLVVVYDGKGIFSAARVWWMFRAFSHENVVVLDGGLPKWLEAGYEVENEVHSATLEKIEASFEAVRRLHDGQTALINKPSFRAVLQPRLVWSLNQVKQNIEDNKFQLIDARSKARFDGTVPEPRAGIRGGHVPGSKCVPFTEVLSSSGTLLAAKDVEKKFADAEVGSDVPIVTSCGTGVTACILALALFRLGKEDVPVYDGSWTEWGSSPDTPVAVHHQVTLS